MNPYDDRPDDGYDSDLLEQERIEGLAAVYVHLRRLTTGPVSGALSRTQEQALRVARESEWEQSAACASVDPEEWFPDKGGSTRAAVAICAGCPVRRSCLATALLLTEVGVWAGTTAVQRRSAYRALRAGTDADAVLDQLLTRHPPTRDHGSNPGVRWSGREAPELRQGDTAA